MKLSIGVKILALLGVTTVVGLGLAFSSYRGTNELISASGWVSHTYQVINEFEAVRLLLVDSETGQRGYLITGDARYLEPYTNAVGQIEQHINSVQTLTSDNPHQQNRIAELRTMVRQRVAQIEDVIATRKSSGLEGARKAILSGVSKASMDEIRGLLDKAVGEERDLLVKRDQINAEYATALKNSLIGGAALFVFIFFLTAVFIRRGIIDPLTQVMSLANQIASGNLKQEPLKISSRDEVGELATIFNSMLAFLKEMAAQNLDVSRNLGTAASQILAAIQQQAAAVREQATAIQQTTTTMEEIGQSGAQVSERGRQISSSAEATLGAANAGIGAVQGTNQTMISIRSQVESVAENIVNLSERNQTIGEIISSVNDIAEQSNLLSLNAAIEAADAGDHGRRFSVVANELKNLSEQAKNATVQVRSILGQIQKGINTSVMLTEEAVKRAEGGKLQADIAEKTILQLTGTTTDSVKTFQQIMGAANQQQIGFEQITQALKSIRVGAEQTAASTSQLEKAALSLNTLGQQLQATAQRYKI